ncbi:MAG: PhnD/SsuA/transferrin family substrate-binding protein [Alphaproteobacteria bacterium]|nr:PhnD/SsuA/transferrin family substrate-binding protein [Alphaproteobacteria bacterium]
MIASLPMYDWPEIRAATDDWWKGIARHIGIDAALQRVENYASLWLSSDLLFSQTCGYPFTHEFAGKLTYVATPHYDADGCAGPNYRSIVFAREMAPLESFRGCTVAFNSPDSMSGMLALKLVFAPYAVKGRFFGRAFKTGGHLNSLRAVREGAADVCAIDAVCVGLARRHRPQDLDGLVEIARSPSVPGLPYVTVAGNAMKLRQAVSAALDDPDLGDVRDQLLLSGLSVFDPQDYIRIVDLEIAMERAGGLELK